MTNDPLPQPDEVPDEPVKMPPGFEPVPREMGRQRPEHARLTVLAHAYHYPPGGSPEDTPLQWTEQLTSDEQRWRRWFTTGPEWQELECGWLEDVGCSLLILTVEGKAGPAVELGVEFGEKGVALIAAVKPGGGAILPCPNVKELMVRCQPSDDGKPSDCKARCCLTLIPE